MSKFKNGIVLGMIMVMSVTVIGFAQQKKVTLTVWSQDSSEAPYIVKEAKIFNQQHPNLKLTIKDLVIPGGDQPTKFLSVLATGDLKLLPDMICPQHFAFARFVRAGIEDEFINLRPYLEKNGLSNFPSYEMWMYNDAVYGVNVSLCAVVYYYNKEVMDRVGINPQNFMLWDDFIEAGKKLKNATGAYMTPLDIASWNQYLIFALQNDGGIFDKAGNVILDKPETIEALELYKRLLDEGVAWPTSQFYGVGTKQAYREEKVAGCIMAGWYSGAILSSIPEIKGKWRITLLPRFKPGGRRTSKRGGSAYHIPKNSPNAEVALEFWKHLQLNPKAQARRFAFFGKFPGYKPAFKEPIVKQYKDEFLGYQKTAEVYLDAFGELPRFYHHPYIAEAFDILNADVISQVVTNKLTPEEALRLAADKLRKIIGR